MSALTVGVNSSETLWTVDEVPDPEFGYYTVGSEIVRVIAGFPASTGYAHGEVFPAKIRVSRGTNGTSAASHISGSALTAANAFAGGGGGGGLTVTGSQGGSVAVAGSLILPGTVAESSPGVATSGLLWTVLEADIAYNTPDLNNPANFGPAVLTIPAGSFFQVFVMVSTEWDADGDLDLIVASDDQGNNTLSHNVATYIPQVGTTTPGDAGAFAEPRRSDNSTLSAPSVQNGIPRWAFAVLERVVCVGFYPAAGNPTQGAGKVVAIVATPAT